MEPKPKKWIQDMTWLNLVALSKLQQFAQVIDQVSGVLISGQHLICKILIQKLQALRKFNNY